MPGLLLAWPLIGAGCSKAGSGSGTRAERPGFAETGTIFNNGPQNQQVPTNPNYDPTSPNANNPTPTMNPQALQILATCFDLPGGAAEVEPIVGWTDPTLSVTAANALCAYLNKAGYPPAVPSLTLQPADIDK